MASRKNNKKTPESANNYENIYKRLVGALNDDSYEKRLACAREGTTFNNPLISIEKLTKHIDLESLGSDDEVITYTKPNGERVSFTNNENQSIMSKKKELPMKDEVKNRVIVDLLANPITLVPVVGGATVALASWVFGSALLAFAGICGVLGGLGIFATRLVWGLEDITKKAYDDLQRKQKIEKEEELDSLDSRLTQDKDPRPENCLRELRSLRELLDSESSNSLVGGKLIRDSFDQMFAACVERIKKTDDLWRLSRSAAGVSKKNLISQREKIVVELMEATEHLASVVKQTNEIKEIKEDSELSEMRKELERNLLVARKTEQRISNLDKPNYDVKEFE